jgi:hypothetical protein
MLKDGGDFIYCLAVAWLKADASNRSRIETTWSDEWSSYMVLAHRCKQEVRHDYGIRQDR